MLSPIMQYKATALAAQKRGTENVGGNGDEADASSIHVLFLSPTAETENMGKFGFGYSCGDVGLGIV